MLVLGSGLMIIVWFLEVQIPPFTYGISRAEVRSSNIFTELVRP